MTEDSVDLDEKQAQAFRVWEPHIRSFVALCLMQAHDKPVTGARAAHDLSGLSVGVKDIIDVVGVPTRNGSAAFADAEPARSDAPVVASLRAAGARIVGKTVTTECAFTDPTECRNPYDLNRTPGGSSSGSGAAVAAGLVDLALGTQTAGSLCRPAAYCGAVGIKPSYGTLPVQGVTPLAPSFDTVGIIARSFDVAQRAFLAMTGATDAAGNVDTRLATALLPTSTEATADTMAAFRDAAAAIGPDGSVPGLSLRIDVAAIVAAHRAVMLAEAAEAHGGLLDAATVDLLRPNFRAALQAGAALSSAEVSRARETLARARSAFWRQLADIDVVLTLPVPDGAPLLDGTTGFQDWLTPWTVFGGPLVCLPWGLDSLGRPRSVMLAGHPGRDLEVLALAGRLAALEPPMPPPRPPRR